ncbi:MAG: hypothetical protein AAFV25_08455, partial [Bacteroidota bacterium]
SAWVEVADDPLNTLGGMVDILIDPYPELTNVEEKKELIQRVKRAYFKHRNLGQDLRKITIRQPTEILLKLEIVIPPNCVAEKVLADVLVRLEKYLSSSVQFLSLQQMMDHCNGDVNQVFNGPALLHGFVPTANLLPIMHQVRAIDLIPVIQQNPDVVMVPSLEMRTQAQEKKSIIDSMGTGVDGSTAGRWYSEIQLDRKHYPRLAPTSQHILQVYKGKSLVSINANKLDFEIKKCSSQQPAPKLSIDRRDLPIPSGQFREMEQYLSIQQEFPAIYHLEPHGLPPHADAATRGQVKQLQSYLLYFDQLMANYLAQLSNLGQLYSWDKNIRQTYFCQGLEHSLDNLSRLLDFDPQESRLEIAHQRASIIEQYKVKLAEFTEDQRTFLTRRNRFLEHLLARFGRSLDTFLQSIHVSNATAQQRIEMETRLRLLDHYPRLSSERSRAINPYKTKDFMAQYSGLRQWIETLYDMIPETLDVYHFNKRFVLEHYDPTSKINHKHVFSKYVLTTEDGSAVDFKEIMRIGPHKENFRLDYRKLQGRYHIMLFKITDPLVPAKMYRLTDVYKTPEQTIEVIKDLSNLLAEYNRSSERIYLLEHLLLRPKPIERYFGLQLLDGTGLPWMQTQDWYDKNEIAQIQQPIDDKKNPFVFASIPVDANAHPLKYRVQLIFGATGQTVEMHSCSIFDSKELAEQAIADWQKLFQLSFRQKGNVNILQPWKPLLKPWRRSIKANNPYAQILADPYSFILTVVIPDWPSRFQSQGFKTSLESTICQECPAHLWPNLLWLDKDRFQQYEQLHYMWWSAYLENDPDAYCFREELMNFIMTQSKFTEPTPST